MIPEDESEDPEQKFSQNLKHNDGSTMKRKQGHIWFKMYVKLLIQQKETSCLHTEIPP